MDETESAKPWSVLNPWCEWTCQLVAGKIDSKNVMHMLQEKIFDYTTRMLDAMEASAKKTAALEASAKQANLALPSAGSGELALEDGEAFGEDDCAAQEAATASFFAAPGTPVPCGVAAPQTPALPGLGATPAKKRRTLDDIG